MKYQLINAEINDKEKLIKYKLSTILNHAHNISEEEKTKIINYVNKNVPNDINSYKIITINDKKIGCLLLKTYEDGTMIDELYLEEDYRNKGIGTNILNQIIKTHNKLYLWVYKENKKAIKLYKKLNFKTKEETKTRILMER